MMKRIKNGVLSVLVVTLGFAAAQAADYNGDLIIGFTAEVGTDLEYDLGSASSITNGQTWNLNSLLASFELATVKWGVIGSDANAGYAYATKATGTPETLNEARWASQDLAINSIYSLFHDSGPGKSVQPPSNLANSWNQQTVVGPLTSNYKNVYLNPNTAGLASINIYRIFLNNSAPTLFGAFSLAANGVVTFTTPSSAPPAPKLAITRSGNTSSISFVSSNSATYKLYFTNSTGLGDYLTNWPSLAGTITGDGATKTFTDTTTATNRFYRVNAY